MKSPCWRKGNSGTKSESKGFAFVIRLKSSNTPLIYSNMEYYYDNSDFKVLLGHDSARQFKSLD